MYKRQILTDHEKCIVAYHEIGHALVAAKQSNSAPVQKITIIPRTSGALGYTMQVDEGNHYLMNKAELENKIATLTLSLIHILQWLASSLASCVFRWRAGMMTSVSTLSGYLKTEPLAFMLMLLSGQTVRGSVM